MPHLSIKHYPRDLTGSQKSNLADALTKVIMEHLGTHEGVISICLEPIEKEQWMERVYVPEITGKSSLLIKTPNY